MVYRPRNGGLFGRVLRGFGLASPVQEYRYLSDYERYRRAVTGTVETYYSAMEFKLGWLGDAWVSGGQGIRPRFKSDAANDEWDIWTVDPNGLLSPRDFQRVILFGLILHGEAFVRLVGPKFQPIGRPMRIAYDDMTGMATHYIYAKDTLPAEEVWHIFIPVRAGQKRGDCLFDAVRDISEERRAYVLAAVKLAKMAANLWLMIKRGGGGRIDADSTAANTPNKDVTKFDATRDQVLQLDLEDEVITPSLSAPPMASDVLDKTLGSSIAFPYGISRMSLMGDFSDVNYSSGRMAILLDARMWQRYQEKILGVVKRIYREWPGFPIYGQDFDYWYLPRMPHIDPTRVAAANKILVDMGAKAVQEVILEDDRDPETTFRLIDEYRNRRRGNGDG